MQLSVRWPLCMTYPALTRDYVDALCPCRKGATDRPVISNPKHVSFFIVYLHYESDTGGGGGRNGKLSKQVFFYRQTWYRTLSPVMFIKSKIIKDEVWEHKPPNLKSISLLEPDSSEMILANCGIGIA